MNDIFIFNRIERGRGPQRPILWEIDQAGAGFAAYVAPVRPAVVVSKPASRRSITPRFMPYLSPLSSSENSISKEKFRIEYKENLELSSSRSDLWPFLWDHSVQSLALRKPIMTYGELAWTKSKTKKNQKLNEGLRVIISFDSPLLF